jgi:hypothetical protein
VTVSAALAETTAVSVGSDTDESLFDQFSGDYNAMLKSATAVQQYSFDATNPVTGAEGDLIVTKPGCSAIARPDGSSAGITAFDANVKTSDGKPRPAPAADVSRSPSFPHLFTSLAVPYPFTRK